MPTTVTPHSPFSLRTLLNTAAQLALQTSIPPVYILIIALLISLTLLTILITLLTRLRYLVIAGLIVTGAGEIVGWRGQQNDGDELWEVGMGADDVDREPNDINVLVRSICGMQEETSMAPAVPGTFLHAPEPAEGTEVLDPLAQVGRAAEEYSAKEASAKDTKLKETLPPQAPGQKIPSTESDSNPGQEPPKPPEDLTSQH